MGFNPIQALGGGIGAGFLGDLFGGGKDPSKAANKYFEKIPGELHQYFDPYINRGNRSGDILEGQYGSLLNDPGGMLNKIGGGYQQSPGFQFALKQALQGAGNAAAAGGMAGSPQHELQNMGLATNLANQDYNSWIKNALGLYGQGLGGEEGLYGTGARAGMGMGENLASLLAQQGRMAYESAAGQNAKRGQDLSNIISGAGSLLAFL